MRNIPVCSIHGVDSTQTNAKSEGKTYKKRMHALQSLNESVQEIIGKCAQRIEWTKQKLKRKKNKTKEEKQKHTHLNYEAVVVHLLTNFLYIIIILCCCCCRFLIEKNQEEDLSEYA